MIKHSPHIRYTWSNNNLVLSKLFNKYVIIDSARASQYKFETRDDTIVVITNVRAKNNNYSNS